MLHLVCLHQAVQFLNYAEAYSENSQSMFKEPDLLHEAYAF